MGGLDGVVLISRHSTRLLEASRHKTGSLGVSVGPLDRGAQASGLHNTCSMYIHVIWASVGTWCAWPAAHAAMIAMMGVAIGKALDSRATKYAVDNRL